MSHLKPVPAPRKKVSEDLDAPPPIPPKPKEGILKGNSERDHLKLKSFNKTSNKPLPLPKPRSHINKNVAFRDTAEVFEHPQNPIELKHEYNYPDEVEGLLCPLKFPPVIPPRPKDQGQRSSFALKLDKVIKTNLKKSNSMKGFIKNQYVQNNNIEENNDDLAEDANQEIIKEEPLPTRNACKTVKVETKHLDNITYELECFSKKLLDSELQYIKKLEGALEVSEALQSADLPEPIITKFFGLLEDIHKFHKEIFYKDLSQNSNNPKVLLHCFLKHAPKFSLYIERQWLITKNVHLTEFEKFVIEERDLTQYTQMSKERMMDYIKMLTYLKSSVSSSDSETYDHVFLINEAIRVVENIYYQLEMTERLQSIENIRNKYKDCGEVYLHDKFKVSINGNKRQRYEVYLCKYLILFAKVEENGNVQYCDDILVSDCYCCILKSKHNVFEIGIKNRNRYILTSDLPSTRDKWREHLKKVLFYRYTEI